MNTLPLARRWRPWGLLAALATGLCLAIPTASAGDQAVTKTPPAKKAKAKAKAEKPGKVKRAKLVVTGSYLPQEIESGKQLVTAVPVDIITSDQIRRMGATSVPYVLSRQTSFR
jgi:outer membrane cobalamin receptor